LQIFSIKFYFKHFSAPRFISPPLFLKPPFGGSLQFISPGASKNTVIKIPPIVFLAFFDDQCRLSLVQNVDDPYFRTQSSLIVGWQLSEQFDVLFAMENFGQIKIDSRPIHRLARLGQKTGGHHKSWENLELRMAFIEEMQIIGGICAD
jgi:hypothetical protein